MNNNCPRLGFDLHLSGEKLLISGYSEDKYGNPYDLYSVDISNGEIGFLLPSYQKYGVEPTDTATIMEYKQGIGVKGFFDIEGDHVFFAWEGAARIIIQDLKTGKIIKTFGQETAPYKSPVDSLDKFLKPYKERKFSKLEQEKNNVSFVKNLFTVFNYVFLVYEGPGKGIFRLQAYTLDGVFISDVPIPGKPNARMWFDKEKKILYSLGDNSRREYFIQVYQVRVE